MALQTIDTGNSDDVLYRCKVPRMIARIEGKGNGIKTNVVNMVDIAKALARPASYPTRFLGHELGAISIFDKETGNSFLRGPHETAKLVEHLAIFIKKYVLCRGCGSPQTEMIIADIEIPQLKCSACGFAPDLDMNDYLIKFILRSHYRNIGSNDEERPTIRAEKVRLKEAKATHDSTKKLREKPAGTSSSDDNAQWWADTSAEASHLRNQEQLSAVMLSSTATSASEKSKNKVDIEGGDEKGNAEGSSAHEKLVEEIKRNLNKGSTVSQLQAFLETLDGTPEVVTSALFDALFQGVKNGFAKEVHNKRSYLAAAAAEKEGGQITLLRAIDNFCRNSKPDVVKEVVLVLKSLYDADILGEEYIVKWYEGGVAGENGNSQIWKKIKPFIEWLIEGVV